ncbi:hypothetical protein AYO40_00770 [Planctomycetaceae bacterium SCGC AG-212-D15]|nr:hypothetical protein AYO40_00770 [Planctomycetaceae bacterium SCGC AG-212-D15]
MNYEIPFVQKDDHGSLSDEKLKNRLAVMTSIVDKLKKEEWYLSLTLTGVEVTPGRSVLCRAGLFKDGHSPNDEDVKAFIHKRFAELGIDESFRLASSRSVNDLLTEDVRHSDRVWYDQAERRLRYGDDHPESDEKWDFLRTLGRMERLYGRQSLVIADSYERGVLHGRLQALRWILGAGWEDSKFPDYRKADLDPECDGEERVWRRTDANRFEFLSGLPSQSVDVEPDFVDGWDEFDDDCEGLDSDCDDLDDDSDDDDDSDSSPPEDAVGQTLKLAPDCN